MISRGKLTLRAATADDLDSIVEIVCAGFPDDPEVDYRFPRREEFPEDYLKWTRIEYQHYIEQDDKFVVHLVEAQHSDSVGRSVGKPIGLAVWDVAVMTASQWTDEGLDKRRDANQEHCRAFSQAARTSFQDHFAKYGGNQIHLWLLVVHPSYRRQGAGAMLVEWGLNTAKERRWPTTVFASSMGELIYSKLGFKQVGTKIVRVEREEQQLSSAVMEKIPLFS